MTFDREMKISAAPPGDDAAGRSPSNGAPVRPAVMSEQDLAALGAPKIVYMKSSRDEGMVGLHAADGSLLGEFPSLQAAFGVVQMNELALVSVH